MGRVISADHTVIAYERSGSGPAVILVGGGLDDGSENVPLAAALSARFTVYNYARRGRAESTDTSPYDVAREIEDIDAIIAEAGGTAHLYGVSTGGALALEAAAAGSRVGRIGVYEVPYNATDDDWPQLWRNYVRDVNAVLSDGRRGDAVELFLRVTGASESDIAGMRSAPFWPALETQAHTLPYDAATLGDGQPPRERLTTIAQPTLVITGDDRPAGAPTWIMALDSAADVIADCLPHARRVTLDGQGHVADPTAVVPVLERFFADDGSGEDNGYRFGITEAAHHGDERTALIGVLQRQRDLVAWKLRDATEAVLRQAQTSSGMSMHGLVQHLTNVERSWIRDVFAGQRGLRYDWTDEDPDAEWRVPTDTTMTELLADYAAEARLCDAVAAGATSLDQISATRNMSLRWILLHLIEETARHLGHLDLLREQADGSTGEEPTE